MRAVGWDGGRRVISSSGSAKAVWSVRVSSVSVCRPVTHQSTVSRHCTSTQDHSEVYVHAMDGQAYGIRLQNYTKDVLTTKVYVDGT